MALIVTLFAGCTKSSKAPESRDFSLWKSEAQEKYQKKFGVPAKIHHIYLTPQNNRAFFKNDRESPKLVASDCGPKCTHSFRLDKNMKVWFRGQSRDPEKELGSEPSLLNEQFYASANTYEGIKEVRVFLYDLAQKNLEAKRKKYFFDYDNKFVFEGKFRWLDQKKEVIFQRSNGTQKSFSETAKIQFKVDGRETKLTIYNEEREKVDKKINDVFVMYRDKSNGNETYGAGRYLLVVLPKKLYQIENGDKVTVDFNYSYNPPCAASSGFHCPLPQDFIDSAVLVGEKYNKVN